MTDSEKLSQKISAKGLKLCWIADQMGITYPSLQNKIRNVTAFKASEILVLSDLLGLSTDERDALFFARNVDGVTT